MSAAYVLRCYGPESDFTCDNYLDWGFNFATKITVNEFFNNKQTVKRLSIRKVLLVQKNVKERNKQYFKFFLFFTEVTNVKYSDRMVFIKYR